MSRFIAFLIIFSSVFLGNAFAQKSNAYQGFYGQVALGYEGENVNASSVNNIGSPSSSTSLPSSRKSTLAGIIGVGYTIGLDTRWSVGMGVDYGPITSKTDNAVGSPDAIGLKVANRLNIFVTPGYSFGTLGDQLVYLKAGYSNEQLQASYQTPGPSSGQSIGNSNVNGYVLGFGYKTPLVSGIYAYGEANYYSYSGASFPAIALSNGNTISGYNPNASAYQFLLGVGYKF